MMLFSWKLPRKMTIKKTIKGTKLQVNMTKVFRFKFTNVKLWKCGSLLTILEYSSIQTRRNLRNLFSKPSFCLLRFQQEVFLTLKGFVTGCSFKKTNDVICKFIF